MSFESPKLFLWPSVYSHVSTRRPVRPTDDCHPLSRTREKKWEVFDERSQNAQALTQHSCELQRQSAKERALAQAESEEAISAANFLITLLGDCAKRPTSLDLGTLKYRLSL